ncbi:MAG: hypothetical protein MZU97_11695 [Bacillus subtilis]|nr:hypothetical protein [Bacillus subtilis]
MNELTNKAWPIVRLLLIPYLAFLFLLFYPIDYEHRRPRRDHRGLRDAVDRLQRGQGDRRLDLDHLHHGDRRGRRGSCSSPAISARTRRSRSSSTTNISYTNEELQADLVSGQGDLGPRPRSSSPIRPPPSSTPRSRSDT